jgi:regulator of sigma E protease
MPFVVGGISEGSKNTALQAKDIILALNNEPAKYFDQAKAILEKYKSKTILATVLRDEKK